MDSLRDRIVKAICRFYSKYLRVPKKIIVTEDSYKEICKEFDHCDKLERFMGMEVVIDDVLESENKEFIVCLDHKNEVLNVQYFIQKVEEYE